MNVKFYVPDDVTLTAGEINRGLIWVYADVKCPRCGKEQPVAATGHIGGSCVACGERTCCNAE